MASAADETRIPRYLLWPAIAIAWPLLVVFFAAQWYAYDASHGIAEPFHYYLWCCGYTWALLTPTALWLGWRFPVRGSNWQRRLPLHLAASLLLTTLLLALEASLHWLRSHDSLSPSAALRTYLTHYGQVSLLAYWVLFACIHLFRAREEAREGRLRAARLEAQLSEARLEALRRQLHPHFLFNTLQAAITLIHEDRDRAEDVLLRLSELLRTSLEDSRTNEISLARELEILSLYTGIQSCRFGDRLRFEVRVAADVLECAVPPMILQPLVENAVRHGIGRHKGTDAIVIRGYRQESSLCLEVSNGNSRLDGANGDLARNGIGLATTRERLDQLYGVANASLVLKQLEPEGVIARVSLPIHRAGAQPEILRTRTAAL